MAKLPGMRLCWFFGRGRRTSEGRRIRPCDTQVGVGLQGLGILAIHHRTKGLKISLDLAIPQRAILTNTAPGT